MQNDYARSIGIILTFACELFRRSGLPPLLLFESFATGSALGSASVMLASADQLLRHLWVHYVTSIRMTVAHAPATNTDVFDGVEVLE